MASKLSVIEQEQRAYIKFGSLLKDSGTGTSTMISWKFVVIKHLLIPRLEDGLNYSEREETALNIILGTGRPKSATCEPSVSW